MNEYGKIPPVLTIAGSDSSGGAGIQADLKTMAAHKVYGMSVITSITAQNTCGVQAVENISESMIRKQIDAVFQDIPPVAVKIGMLSTKEAVQAVADALKQYQPGHIVLDPVMVATSGHSLIENETVPYMVDQLFPLADVVTPNLPEAEAILKLQSSNVTEGIKDCPAMEEAAKIIYDTYGCSVLIKGGHLTDRADDILYDGTPFWYSDEKISTQNTHGTGCTLSSSIACHLALGFSLQDAVAHAKTYVRQAMSAGFDLGKGNGPLWHGCMS